jgi:serine/threonine protein kinase
MDQIYLVIICIGSCICSACSLGYDIYIALKLRELAYSGDVVAAKRIILPCYKPLIKWLLIFNALFAVALALTFVNPKVDTYRILIYYFFSLLTIYNITPVMLVQTSVSNKAFWNTFYTIFPWWFICTILWAFSDKVRSKTIVLILQLCFIIIATLPPFLLAAGILTKLVSSRVQIGSSSNRNSTELLLIYSLSFGIIYVIGIVFVSKRIIVDFVMTIFAFCIHQIYPLALYRTLLADTKFWRGLGKHNQSGMDKNDILRQSGVDVHRPTMELSVVSSTFQDMMADINDITVDFAYLQLEKMIGQGATAKVFCGKFKRKLVAIKLSTPPEITDEVMDVFVSEAKVAAVLKHKNIVEFMGICVRPPQIGMVFEFCEGGNLKTNLQKNPFKWTSRSKLQACLDASRAIECLHSYKLIHRDIKAENFFVGKKLVVKLGDFGETTRFRTAESTQENRMTIVGTVAFMAPELVAGARHYTESIDIYALGVTFWEIWTLKDPYDGYSTFDIYNHVKAGKRLSLPEDAPAEFNSLMESTWLSEASERPTASQLVMEMEKIITNSSKTSDMEEDEGDGADDDNTKNPILKRVGNTVMEMVTMSRRDSDNKVSRESFTNRLSFRFTKEDLPTSSVSSENGAAVAVEEVGGECTGDVSSHSNDSSMV